MTIVDLVEHWLGLTNASGKTYLWWSGFFGNVAIFAAVFVFVHHHTCHVHRCWRPARHPVDGTPFVVCAKHHPRLDGPPTSDDVRRAHDEAKRREAQGWTSRRR